MPEKDKDGTTSSALKAISELTSQALKNKPTSENTLLAAQIAVLSIIACELHDIGTTLNLLNKEK